MSERKRCYKKGNCRAVGCRVKTRRLEERLGLAGESVFVRLCRLHKSSLDLKPHLPPEEVEGDNV